MEDNNKEQMGIITPQIAQLVDRYKDLFHSIHKPGVEHNQAFIGDVCHKLDATHKEVLEMFDQLLNKSGHVYRGVDISGRSYEGDFSMSQVMMDDWGVHLRIPFGMDEFIINTNTIVMVDELAGF
jgi:hypothetical protein